MTYSKEQLDAVRFDPTKSYRWDINENFNFSGKDFSLLFNNALSLTTGAWSMENMFKLMGIYSTLEAKFKEGVLNGVITEAPVMTQEPQQVQKETKKRKIQEAEQIK